jgi:hypothetical protein
MAPFSEESKNKYIFYELHAAWDSQSFNVDILGMNEDVI